MPALGRLREKGLCELEVVVGYTECSRSAGAGVGLRRKQRKWKERRKEYSPGSVWYILLSRLIPKAEIQKVRSSRPALAT